MLFKNGSFVKLPCILNVFTVAAKVCSCFQIIRRIVIFLAPPLTQSLPEELLCFVVSLTL